MTSQNLRGWYDFFTINRSRCEPSRSNATSVAAPLPNRTQPPRARLVALRRPMSQRLLDLGRGERRGSGLVDLPPDRQRRPRWRDNDVDRGCDELIEPALHHGRKIRSQRAAPFAGHSQPFHPTITYLRNNLNQCEKDNLILATH